MTKGIDATLLTLWPQTDSTRKGFKILCWVHPLCVYPLSTWCHHAWPNLPGPPLHICILQAIKHWRWDTCCKSRVMPECMYVHKFSMFVCHGTFIMRMTHGWDVRISVRYMGNLELSIKGCGGNQGFISLATTIIKAYSFVQCWPFETRWSEGMLQHMWTT